MSLPPPPPYDAHDDETPPTSNPVQHAPCNDAIAEPLESSKFEKPSSSEPYRQLLRDGNEPMRVVEFWADAGYNSTEKRSAILSAFGQGYSSREKIEHVFKQLKMQHILVLRTEKPTSTGNELIDVDDDADDDRG